MVENRPENQKPRSLNPLIGVHFSSEDPFNKDTEHSLENRGDTLSMPNAGIGVLLTRAQKEGIEERRMYDTTFPGELQTIAAIESQIEKLIWSGETPRVFASVLSYNAQASMQFLERLKRKYNDKVITGVGGQLIGKATKAYIANPYIDVIGVGDAELILLPMMKRYQDVSPAEFRASLTDEKIATDLDKRDPSFGLQDAEVRKKRIDQERLRQLGKYKVVAGWLAGINKKKKRHEGENFKPFKYDLPSYDPSRYAFIEKRKEAMKKVLIGPKRYGVSGMVMLLSEFGRQCDWAGSAGACSFCALIGVEDPRNFQDIATYVKHIRDLKQQHPDLNWIFDVSNQLLEQRRQSAIKFLTQLAQEREKYPELAEIKTYAYLTVGNLNRESAPLLRRCGIDVVYIGLESFDPQQWRIQNKSNTENTVAAAFLAAQKHGIKIRTSFVLGINTSEQSLKKEVEGLRQTLQKYPDVFLTIGVHKVEIIPGSRDFVNFKKENEKLYHDPIVFAIYEHFEEKGFLDRDQQVALTKAFIEWRSRIKALEQQDIQFKSIFENVVGIRQAKKAKRQVLTSIEKEDHKKYLQQQLAYAQEKQLGISYDRIEEYVKRLEEIISQHGIVAHTLEKGSLTGT